VIKDKERAYKVQSFMMDNLPFYTTIFKEFIIALSEKNELSFRDIRFFYNLLGKFNGAR
jgi:hypothetical protein